MDDSKQFNSPTNISNSDIQHVKENIDVENNTKSYNRTPWIILGIVVVLLIMFAAAVIIFFILFNPPAMHEIEVINNSTENINILFGAISPNEDIIFLPTRSILPGQSHQYKATPGTGIIVQGYRDNDTILTDDLNPFTTVELLLAGEGFNGKHQVTDGAVIITDVIVNVNSSDKYGVSMQGGYNVPISISSIDNNNKADVNDNFTCGGPTWNHTIEATGPNHPCPFALQYKFDDYQLCFNPCTLGLSNEFCCAIPGICDRTGGCEQSWNPYEFYTVFSSACPNCLVTNCDNLNYTCNSKDGLSKYIITF